MINQLCVEAEVLYNRIIVLLMDTHSSDFELDALREVYKWTLDSLRASNVGGVRINGVFRNLK